MPEIPTNQLLEVALASANAGAEIAKKYFNQRLDFKSKDSSHTSIVTLADQEAEAAILKIIKSAYPDHDFVGEEGAYQDNGSEYQWSIDPIDGTNSFASGLPWFCVSVGLHYRYRPMVAVIVMPYGIFGPPDTFSAIADQDAMYNGQVTRVNQTASLNKGLVGWNYAPPLESAGILQLNNSYPNFRYSLSVPSSAYQLCLLATGKLDAFWHPNLKHWDIAAADLIVREAGGQTSDITDRPINWHLKEPNQYFSYAASNSLLHNQLIKSLN